MPDIARLYDFQEGDVIDPTEIDNEFDQLVETVNALPDADGARQVDLNADMVDGFHASETGGDGLIPVCNGDIQVALNAEFLGGLTAADFAEAGFPVLTRLIFAQAAPPPGWSLVSSPAVDRVFGWASGAGTGGTNNASTSWANLADHFKAEIPSHVLTVGEIPAHTHTTSFATVTAGPSVESFSLNPSTAFSAYVTSSAGGGGGHVHPDASLNNGTFPSANWRPPIHWTCVGEKA